MAKCSTTTWEARVSVGTGPKDAWSPAPDMPNVHASHAAVRLDDGRVLVCGGSGSNGSASPKVDIYDPAANAWIVAAPMSKGRYRHTATRLSDGTVLVVEIL